MAAHHRLSRRSRTRLEPAHADLQRVVERGLHHSRIDFTVLEVLRSRQRQAYLLEKGLTQTRNSKHFRQQDGTVHAADLLPIDPTVENVWQHWSLFDEMAEGLHRAAVELGIPLVWGAAWGRLLNDHPTAQAAKLAYIDERRAQGRRPFLDGAHFELGPSYRT